MTETKIREILGLVATRRMSADQALSRLRHLPFEDLGFARIDNHRSLRRGVPEVVFGEGKSADQIAIIGRRMAAAGVNLIVTRLAADKARALKRKLPRLDYRAEAQIGLVVTKPPEPRGHGTIMVVSAGTSDIPVAEEAAPAPNSSATASNASTTLALPDFIAWRRNSRTCGRPAF